MNTPQLAAGVCRRRLTARMISVLGSGCWPAWPQPATPPGGASIPILWLAGWTYRKVHKIHSIFSSDNRKIVAEFLQLIAAYGSDLGLTRHMAF